MLRTPEVVMMSRDYLGPLPATAMTYIVPMRKSQIRWSSILGRLKHSESVAPGAFTAFKDTVCSICKSKVGVRQDG